MRHIWRGLGLMAALVLVLVVGSSLTSAAPPAADLAIPTAPDQIPSPVRVKFDYDAARAGDGIYVNYNATADLNTLRVYGHEGEGAAFPYEEMDGPFNLAGPEAPAKDFIVWNPAYMYHLDDDPCGTPTAEYQNFFQDIVVNGHDANEKVYLKQWYVPKYTEPRGCVWKDLVPGDYVKSADIVKEYTYLLLDTQNNPIAGYAKISSIILPIADRNPFGGAQRDIGLDSYEAIEGIPYATVINNIWPAVPGRDEHVSCPAWCDQRVVVDLGIEVIEVITEGTEIQFLDHSVEIVNIDADSVQVDLYYRGNDEKGLPIGTKHLDVGDVLSAGRHNNHTNKGVDWDDPATYGELYAVDEPWYLELQSIIEAEPGKYTAFVRVGRLVQEGETFFVDAAEYDVAKIGWEYDAYGDPMFKYITLRNPLPKVEDVNLEAMTVIKKSVVANEPLPLLPPFNMLHDIIDDTNIPDAIAGNPDGQYPDNPGPDLDAGYRYIADRKVEDVGAVEEKFVAEAKEGRFDTSFTEEKFVGPNEEWQWLNIETMPWSYTEFVLPEQPDITDPGPDEDDGDYILVSSFMTEDSIGVCDPVAILDVTSNSPVDFGEAMEFVATVVGNEPITYDWDFGGTGTATDDDGPTPTFTYNNSGTFTVTLTVENCPNQGPYTDTFVLTVKVKCFGDFNDDGTRNIIDLQMQANAWNTEVGDPLYEERFDVDNDGDVDIVDLMLVALVFGTDCP